MSTYEQKQSSALQKYIPPWLMNRWGAAWGIAISYLIFYILWTKFHWGATESFRLIPQWNADKNYLFITDITFQPLQLFAIITAWRIAFNRSHEIRLRRAWFFLGFAVAAQLLADSTWMYLEIFLGEPPFPSFADVFYLTYYPFALIGLLTLPGAHLRSEQRLRVVLDLAIVMVAMWMVAWFFIISPTSAQYETGKLDQFVATAYPILDLVVVGGALFLLFRKNTLAVRSMLLIYFTGLLMFVASDMLFAYVSLTGSYTSGGWIDILWITAYVIFALAALRQMDTTSFDESADISAQVFTGSSMALPFAAIILGYGMMIYVASQGSNANSTTQGVFIGAGLLTIFVVGRQALIAGQNAKLFKEAQELRIAAEQANKAKSAFMANMSHELRTPLNAIIGFTRIVRRKAEGVLPEKQTENLDKVLSSSEHLLGLINTVLDIAKIEAGRMDVLPVNFDLTSLTDQCINLAIPLLNPGVKLIKNVVGDTFTVFSDEEKIKQIVLNLLSNAAKFTHDGNITLSVTHDSTFMYIAVKDSGIGISKEALGKVFEEFQQAETTTTRQYGGTGLGLAISRNLARLLGGDLTAASELGKGSTFTLSTPIQYKVKSEQTVD
ncbi:MAG: ATP-binding protein [Anaerolineales bacterium]